MATFFPKTKSGRWSVWSLVATMAVLVVFIVLFGPKSEVVNTNTGQEVSGKINDNLWSQLPMYAIFFLAMLSGILGVTSLFKHERSIFVYLAILVGLSAVTIFIGGFFNTA